MSKLILRMLLVLCILFIVLTSLVLAEANTPTEVNSLSELQAAINNATGDMNLKLGDSYNSKGMLTIVSNYNFTIDLNGKTMRGETLNTYTKNTNTPNTNTAIEQNGTGTLTIIDAGTGGLVYANTLEKNQGAIHIKKGNLEIKGGKVNGGYGEAIYCEVDGRMAISENAFVTSSYAYGGTITFNSSSITDSITFLKLTGGTVENTSVGGTAIYSYGPKGKVSIPSGTPIIKCAKQAMNYPPDLSGYAGVQVTASNEFSGTPVTEYREINIATYKYLAFQAASVIQDVAEIDGKGYPLLQTAIDAVTEGQTIKLLRDITIQGAVKILNSTPSFTLDLNGKTLDGDSQAAIEQNSTGTLTIIDSSGNDSGKVTAAGYSTIGYYALGYPTVIYMRSGNLEIKGGTVATPVNSTAIHISSKCSVTVSGGTVSRADYSTESVNLIYILEGTLNITGGTVRTGVEPGNGADMIYNLRGTVNIMGGTVISGNEIGGIWNAGTLNITGGTVSLDTYPINIPADDCVTNISGGTISSTGNTIVINNNATLNISGGTISSREGTAIYFCNSTNNIGKIKIPSGNPIISGKKMAMNKAPDLSDYNDVMITASTYDPNGVNSVGPTTKDNIDTDAEVQTYKYLKFGQITPCTINYDANGGSGTMANGSAIQDIAFTLPASSFTAPDGKRFKAWAIGSTAGTQVNAGRSYTFTANTLVYAVWEDIPTDYVAEINDWGYDTLQKAIDAVNQGQTIKLLSDIALATTVTIDSGRPSFTLDLSGKTIDGNLNPAIDHKGNGTLTITDSSTGATGKVTTAGNQTFANYGRLIVAEGTVGNTAADQGRTISNNSIKATVTVSGGTVSATGSNGTAIYSSSGKIVIPSGTPIISGKKMAMTKAPDLSGYEDAKITASKTDSNGIGAVPITKDDIDTDAEVQYYKYLNFGQSIAPATYTITYNANSGSGTMVNGSATQDTAFTLPASSFNAPSGKRFKAWAIGSAAGSQVSAGGSYTFTANTTVYAVWEAISTATFTITYAANGGSGTMANDTASQGTAFKLPASSFTAPNGKRFKAWAIGRPDGSKVSAGESFTFITDTTVYAVWEDIPANCVAEINDWGYVALQDAVDAVKEGQTIKLLKDITVIDGDKYASPVTIDIDRPSFTLDLNGKKIDGGDFTPITHNGSGTLTIIDSTDTTGKVTTAGYGTLVVNYGSLVVAGGTIENTATGTTGNDAEDPITIANYSEQGSVTVSGGTVCAIGSFGTAIDCLTDGSRVIISGGTVSANGNNGRAIYNRMGTLNISGGTVSAAAEAIYNGNVGKITVSGNAKITSTNGNPQSGTIYLPIGMADNTVLEITGGTVENIVLGCAIYNSDNGKIVIPSGTPVIKSGKIAMNRAPDLSGYDNAKIMASKTDPNGIDAVPITKDDINTDQKVRAYKYLSFEQSTAPSSYTITYNANGGSGTMANGTASQGTAFTLPASSFTAPSGKRFKAWAIGSTAGAQVNAGGSYTFTANTTVYAVWEDIPIATYTITYNANGGSGTMANGTASQGTAFTLPASSFTAPSGKRFKAWAIGIATGSQVNAGGSYAFTANTTVYALWEDISVAEINGTGYNTLQNAVNAVTEGQTIKLLIDITLGIYATVNIDSYRPSFTLDLNGKTIDGNNYTAIAHSGSGTLTIIDSSTGANGKVTTAGNYTLSNMGSLIVAGGTVENTATSGGTAINNNSRVTVSGGTVSANGNFGKAIQCIGNDTSVTISSGTVSANGQYGTAIYNRQGALNITGGMISAAHVAIDNENAGKITVSGNPKITSMNGFPQSGTIYINEGTADKIVLEITGGIVENTVWGNAIYNNANGKIVIPRGTPIITGKIRAMNKAPDLSGYVDVKITASTTDASGINAALITKEGIDTDGEVQAYKYIRFGQITAPANYTIIYDANGGSGSMPNGTAVQGTAFTLPDNSLNAPSGKRFKAWGIGSTSGSEVIADNTFYFTADTTVYAVWEYIPTASVAEINGKGYDTLQKAVDAVREGQTIKLLSDITLTETVTIAGGRPSFTLDLNGRTLDGGSNSVIQHNGSCTLTIADSNTGGKITYKPTGTSGSTIRLSSGDGNLIITGGIVENTGMYAPGAIHNEGAGYVRIQGGTVNSNNTAIINQYTGSVIVSGGTVSAAGRGTINNNFTGSVTISGGTVSAGYTQAIVNNNIGKITISGNAKVTSTLNSSTDGTILLYKGTTDNTVLEITGGTVENTGSSYAIYNYANGKIVIPSGTPVIKGGYIAMNKAPNLIGYDDAKITASKTDVNGNDAASITKGDIDTDQKVQAYKYLNFGQSIVPATYTITYNANGGSGTMANGTASQGTAFTLPTSSFTAPSVKRFKAWAIGSATGSQVNVGGSYTFTANTTVYAVWEDIPIATYSVSGSIKDAADSSVVTDVTVTLRNTTDNTKNYTGTTDINGNYTITGVPDGSYAVNVTKNGETYASGNAIITVSGSNVSGGSANIAVTVPTYTVTYHGNGSDSGIVPADSASYRKEAYATVMGKGSLARNGYNFTGWNTETNGSGISYTVNDTFKINGNVTLYAQWKTIDSAQVPIFTKSNVRGTETVTQGAIAIELSVTAAVSDGGNLSYQWYKNTASTTTGAIAISSATNSSYTPPVDVVGTTYYYVVVTNTLTTPSGVKTSTNTSSIKTVIVLGEPAANYTVSTDAATLNNITLDNTSATQYQNYTTNINADSGYYLPDRITVTMGGRTLVDGVDYIYIKTSNEAGTVTVYNVTGQIAITAAGVLIPTKEYTISFNSNGADAAVGAIKGKYGDTILLPTPTKAGFNFAGWYRDSGFATSYVSTIMGKEDITLFAKWEAITYKISGNVKDEDNNNVNTASVKLMAGSRKVAQVNTDSSGNFSIMGVQAGTYNLVITKGDQTVTLIIPVLNSNVTTGSVTLPKGKKNSVVEVKQGTPDIVVDRLNDFFNSDKFTQDDRNAVDAGGIVEIKLLVEKKDESGDNAAANAGSIKASAEGSGKTVGIFLNLTVSKIITPAGGAAEQPILIEQLSDLLIINIPLPAELQGKSGYVIYRYHGTEVQIITEVKNADGEYIEVSADGKSIKLHTKKFSTYAVGYTKPSTPPTNNTGDGSSHSTVPVKITTEPSEGGRIEIATDNKTATIIPDNGYAITDVIVDGKRIGPTKKYTFTDGYTRKISAVFVKETALPYYNQDGAKVYIGFSTIEQNLYKYIAPANVTVEFMENPKNFIDNTIEWAKPSIDFVTEREIFLGTGQNIFSPNEGMTRAMFVTVIGRLYERSFGRVSGTCTFSDVDAKAYYAKYVGWANENGIIKGIGENKFDPNANVTREQMAVVMFKFTTFLNKTAVVDVSLAYPDSASISLWAIEGAKYCQETKVIEGRTGGVFAPQESATRAEASAILQRFIENMLK